MDFNFFENSLYVEKNEYFLPDLIFDCGQSFRFFSKDENVRYGVAFGSLIEIREEKNSYIITSEPPVSEQLLIDFFDLKRDYREIEAKLIKDEILKKAMEFGRGIRILKQDFFEMLITFIYSQQSNIPRISKCVEKTAEIFGTAFSVNGKTFYSFPTPEQMKDITLSDLEPVKCGYRGAYVIDAVEKVISGEISYNELKNMSYQDAKKKLLTVKGIGEKVADCICLFSLGFFEAFPTDTWIKKAMDSLYNIKEMEIKSASKDMFGNLSGIAQQYLFYYLRYNK